MYFVIEHQRRTDGVTNISETGRQNFASALSYYLERQSKLLMDTTFVSGHLMLVDEFLHSYKQDDVETQYKPAEDTQESQESSE